MVSIGRAVFFTGFAISMIMFGLAFDFLLALRSGAILTLALAVLLMWFAQNVQSRRPENCEAWLLLREDERPESEAARRVFFTIMHDTYLYFAVRVFAIGAVMLTLSVLLGLTGLSGGLGNSLS
ncbi:MAG: hypothetical protein ACR2O0_15160 [Rhizobiaceae bacterium]